MRRPLQKFKKADARLLAIAQCDKCRLVAVPPFPRPFPPWGSKLAAQILERGKARERKRMGLPEAIECPATLRRSISAKRVIGDLQSAHLDARNRSVVQHLGCAQAIDFSLQGRFCLLHKFRHDFDVDVERVEKQPAVWIVGAQFFRPVVEQRMQGIEPYPSRSELRGKVDESKEVGKIPVPPVA